jgi:hypothetical protein
MVFPEMRFGKYKGERLDQIPTSYLRWLLRECHELDQYFRCRILDAIDWQQAQEREERQPSQGRATPPPPVDWSGIIRQWHHEMVMQHHPDRGGDVKVMQALNHAADRLKQLVGVS